MSFAKIGEGKSLLLFCAYVGLRLCVYDEAVWYFEGKKHLCKVYVRTTARSTHLQSVATEKFRVLTFISSSLVNTGTVIPRLTKIIRSGITFLSRNVILYKLYKYVIHFILLN